jgi:hypothetical protein
MFKIYLRVFKILFRVFNTSTTLLYIYIYLYFFFFFTFKKPGCALAHPHHNLAPPLVVVVGGERAYDYLASLVVWFNIMCLVAKIAKKCFFF